MVRIPPPGDGLQTIQHCARTITGMLDGMAARDGPLACLADINKRGNLARRKGYEPGLEELMCSRCLCFRTDLVDKGIGLMPLSALCLSCLIGNSVQFHSHHLSHELLHPYLFNAMRTIMRSIGGWDLGFICYLICVAGMNGICLLATITRI